MRVAEDSLAIDQESSSIRSKFSQESAQNPSEVVLKILPQVQVGAPKKFAISPSGGVLKYVPYVQVG